MASRRPNASEGRGDTEWALRAGTRLGGLRFAGGEYTGGLLLEDEDGPRPVLRAAAARWVSWGAGGSCRCSGWGNVTGSGDGSTLGSFWDCGMGGAGVGEAVFSVGWGIGMGSMVGSFGSSYCSGGSWPRSFRRRWKIFDGAAMEALGLGLKAEERGGDVGLAGEAIEAEGEPIGAVLFERDVDAGGQIGAIEDEWLGGAGHGLVEAVGEEAGFEDGHAAHGVFGEGDAFDGVAFLGIDGLVSRDGIGDEGGDGGAVLNADDGEGVGVEVVLAGVLGGAGFAFFGLRSSGFAGVGLVGGDAAGRGRHRSRSSTRVGVLGRVGAVSDWG